MSLAKIVLSEAPAGCASQSLLHPAYFQSNWTVRPERLGLTRYALRAGSFQASQKHHADFGVGNQANTPGPQLL